MNKDKVFRGMFRSRFQTPANKYWESFFSLALFLFLTLPLFAERLPVKTYTVADGLLRDAVSKIRQDSRGFLWLCSHEGISRFDGYGFTNFTTAEGLPDRHVNDFLETRAGEIWIATDGGLAKLNPTGLAGSTDNPLFSTLLPDNPKARSFNVLFEDDRGEVWIGTDDGVYKLNEKRELVAFDLGVPEPKHEGISISSIIQDRHSATWIGTSAGLFRIIPGGDVESYTTENGLPVESVTVVHEDMSGRIWVGLRPSTAPGGLVLLVPEPQRNQNIVHRHYRDIDGLPDNWIHHLFESSDGRFWIGTIRGLCEWQGDENPICKTYTSKNDICDTDTWSLAEDKDNNIWMGTRCGVKKLARYSFTTYTEADGTGYHVANSIFENTAGDLFVSFNNGKTRTLSRFDGEKFKLIKPIYPARVTYSGWGWKHTVWQDRLGDWWLPTGDGLFRYSEPGRLEELERELPQNIKFTEKGTEVFRLFEDSRGDIWIATTGGTNELWHWDRTADNWHDVTIETGIGAYRIGTAFVEDKAGNLWIGTGSDHDNSALIRYRAGRFTVFSQADHKLLSGWLRDLLVDRDGRLWIASTATGLLRLDDVNADQLNFVRYTPADGLSSIAVSCITDDAFGRIYIGSGRGLDRLNPENGQVENFTTADGLPNSYVDVAYRDLKNDLWFGTVNGLARLVPEPDQDRQPPNVLITGLHVSGVRQAISILGETAVPTLELNADQRHVTVDFVGLGAGLGEKLRYEYRLGGSDWTPTNERTVNFANLGSGGYQFEVRTITSDRIYSGPAIVGFRIAAPIWQRWWFIGGLLTLTIFLTYAFYRYRLTRLLEVANMRTRIATDLHDDIGANLTKISILSEVAKRRAGNGSENLLASIADISRESVSGMSDIVWAINPKKDSLIDLSQRMREYAERTLEESGIELILDARNYDSSLRLESAMRRNIYLIFKESLNNIVRHSQASTVRINFRIENRELILEISDDGVGFEAHQDVDGNGLLNMRKRAGDMGGDLTIMSTKGNGSSMVLRVPLAKGSWTYNDPTRSRR